MGLEKNKLSDDQLDEVFGGRMFFSHADRVREEEEEIKKRQREQNRDPNSRPPRVLS